MALFSSFKRELLKNHERFKNAAAGLQSYAVVLAVLIGGAWATYTFISLREQDIAHAQLHDYEIKEHDYELRKLELERKNREQGVINVEVEAEQASIPNDPGRSIKITVQAKNLGNRNVKVKLPEYALTVARVRPEQDGRLRIEWRQNPPLPYLDASKLLPSDRYVKTVPSELLRAGQTVSFPAWCSVEEVGLYLIEFEAELTGEDLNLARQATGEEEHTFHVVGQTFIVVK
jgi:hypothetical protein